jgi:ABC-type multidrug transport system fused ATPase/permease subunit
MIRVFRQVVSLFDPRERWQLAGLFALMLGVALIQTVGVASVLPFMSVVADPTTIERSDVLHRLYELGGFDSARGFLIFVGVVVLVLMALSNVASGFEHYLMSRFVWRRQHRLSVRLLRRYLNESYTFYLQNNTSGLAKNILTEVGEVINGVLMPGLRMLSQALVVIFVLALLLAVDVAVALSATLFLGGGYGLIYAYIRPRQRRLGQVRRGSHQLRFKTADEALGSIKETKVLGREPEFLRRFAASNRRFSNASASNAVVRDLPRYALDTLAFGGIVIVVLYLVGTRDDFAEAIAVLSLYALAGYRLLPALQQVFRGLSTIRFYYPALEHLQGDLKHHPGGPAEKPRRESEPAPPPIPFERRISLRGLGYRYPGRKSDVLKNVTLDIDKNTSVAFVGSTGSGKTTLVDILVGLLEPQRGALCVDDRTLAAADVPAWRRNLGYVPQHIYLCDDTVTRNIALGVPDAEIDHAAVERAARVAHLHDFVRALPAGYDTVVGERGVRLSGGQRQRIGIARSLYADPEVLILDEATSALDGVTEDAVIQAIREVAKTKTVILVAHRLTTVRECDSIYLFENGEVVASGTYQELLTTNLKFRAMASGGVEGALAG